MLTNFEQIYKETKIKPCKYTCTLWGVTTTAWRANGSDSSKAYLKL